MRSWSTTSARPPAVVTWQARTANAADRRDRKNQKNRDCPYLRKIGTVPNFRRWRGRSRARAGVRLRLLHERRHSWVGAPTPNERVCALDLRLAAEFPCPV